MSQDLPPPQGDKPNHIPDWLRQMRGWEKIPDWLYRFVEETEGIVSPADLQESLAEADSEPPPELTVSIDEDVPDWLHGLEEEAPAEPAAEVPAEEEAIPDWLRGLEEEAPAEPIAEVPAEEEAVPDWLRGLEEEVPAEPVAEVPAEEEAAPDWLPDLEEEVPAELVAEVPAKEEAVPDWLRDLEEEAPAEPTAEIPAEEEAVPDWLRSLEEETPAEPTIEIPAEEEAVPDWLRGLEEEAPAEPAAEIPVEEEGIFDRLSRLEEERAMEPSEEGLAVEEASTPDWLESVGEVSTTEQPPQEPSTTEWLRGVQEMPVPEEVISEEEPVTEEHVPEWIEERRSEEMPAPAEAPSDQDTRVEIPDWLQEIPPEEELAEATQEPPPPQVPEQGEAAPTIPVWMQEMYAAEEEAPLVEAELELPQGETLLTDETPAWLEELRAEGPATSEEEKSVETSGPLAGLRGLLAPEPLLGILPKSTYKPAPPVPETHLAEAKLIEQALSAPSTRPVSVRESPAKKVVASLGQWIIYVALVTAVVVAVFVPEMIEWIQPPEMPEAKAFYGAIEGLPEGSEVLLVLDYDASLEGELTPQARAVIWHLLEKDLGIAAISLSPQGTAIAQDLFQETTERTPGGLYINLGYLPPHPASLQAFIRRPFGGTTLFGTIDDDAQIALGQRVNRFSDLDLIVIVSSTQDHVRWWIEQVGSQRPAQIIAGVSAAIAPYVQPYYNDTGNGQIKGMLVGLAGAAQYESLLGVDLWPSARVNLGLQGYAQIVLILVVLLSGVSSLVVNATRRTVSHPKTRRSDSGSHTGREE